MNLVRIGLFSLALGFICAGFSPGSDAQESRDLNGRIIGGAEWHEISLDSSDFLGSNGTEKFWIRKKKLPDRVQELWFHRSNDPNVPLFQMRYERLHTTYFSSQNFDRSFETLFNGLFRKANVTFDDALSVEKVGRDFKIAWAVGFENSLCLAGLKMFGHTTSDNPEAAGDKSILVLVCRKGEHDRAFLKNTVLSFMSMLKSDGRPVVRRTKDLQAFNVYEANIFGGEVAKQPADSTSQQWEKRSIALQWEGIADLIAGEIHISESSGKGKIQATLPRAQGSCTGQYQMVSRQRGMWSLACSNGLTANGEFDAFGAGKGSSGTGVDSDGNNIKFTVGGN